MLRKFFLSLFILCAGISQAKAIDRYQFDKSHTHILFFVSHVGFSETIGRIREFDGYFAFDEKEPQKGEVSVTLNPASISTDVTELDKVLVGPKFLNVEKFPTILFKSTGVVATGAKTGDVAGNLTLLGVTKPVTLHVTYNKSGIHPFTNNYVSGFSADATFKRSDFGMDAYVPVVGDEVRVHIETEGIDPLKHPGNPKTH